MYFPNPLSACLLAFILVIFPLALAQYDTTGYGSDGSATSRQVPGGVGNGGLGLIGAAAILAAIAGGAAVSQAALARTTLQNNINTLNTNVNTLTTGVATSQANLATQQTAINKATGNLNLICSFSNTVGALAVLPGVPLLMNAQAALAFFNAAMGVACS